MKHIPNPNGPSKEDKAKGNAKAVTIVKGWPRYYRDPEIREARFAEMLNGLRYDAEDVKFKPGPVFTRPPAW